MSDLLPTDDQPTIVTSEPLYPAPIVGSPPAVAFATPVVSEPLPDQSAGAATSEVLTCPECGATQRVTLNRREAADFCRHCDYPLFWTPTRVQRDLEAGSNELALRRLPGTVGRATVASLTCPHCAEPNALTAQTCIRCGLTLHPVAPPPPPPPVYVPPPPLPPVYVEPERGVPWWVWALIGLAFAVTVTLVVLIVTHTIG